MKHIRQYKLSYKQDALNELDNIYLYIKERLKESTIAQNTINYLMEKISNLVYFPHAYKLLKKIKNFEYRKFIIKNYIIIYKIKLEEKEINILHIYNQKQRIKNKKIYSKI